ncbi:hypothetical protein [Ferruginibacter sp.]|uniref:hypothetical protein n=1 Tax=Ferruginibacter sp. TaxID=1940288 RepID=UPI00374CD36C
MTKFITFFIILFLTVQVCVGQVEQLQLYKNLYKTADSLNKMRRLFSIDSITKIEVKKLDKKHPAKYFEKAAELFKTNQFNDASFLYYLGVLRYRFYNSVNPDYQASGDGALAASLQYAVGETINLYLKNNIDNFISALKFTTDYYKNNDYEFYSKQKNIDKYNKLFDNFSNLISDLEKNKEKYKKEWDEERNLMITNIDKAIDEYNKMTPEEKAKLKDNN